MDRESLKAGTQGLKSLTEEVLTFLFLLYQRYQPNSLLPAVVVSISHATGTMGPTVPILKEHARGTLAGLGVGGRGGLHLSPPVNPGALEVCLEVSTV